MARTAARSTTRNPLSPDPGREHRVRERAYHLWEAEGRPHGRDVEYWERARELVGMEESAGSGLLPNPATSPDSPRETGIEEASIQENLGEFPDRFADQGEKTATPKAKPKTRPRKAAVADDRPAAAPAPKATATKSAPPAKKAN